MLVFSDMLNFAHPDQGPRQCDNDGSAATTRPVFQATKLLVFALHSTFVVATPLRHRDLNIFRLFFGL